MVVPPGLDGQVPHLSEDHQDRQMRTAELIHFCPNLVTVGTEDDSDFSATTRTTATTWGTGGLPELDRPSVNKDSEAA